MLFKIWILSNFKIQLIFASCVNNDNLEVLLVSIVFDYCIWFEIYVVDDFYFFRTGFNSVLLVYFLWTCTHSLSLTPTSIK